MSRLVNLLIADTEPRAGSGRRLAPPRGMVRDWGKAASAPVLAGMPSPAHPEVSIVATAEQRSTATRDFIATYCIYQSHILRVRNGRKNL
jgi:hypothetical protein